MKSCIDPVFIRLWYLHLPPMRWKAKNSPTRIMLCSAFRQNVTSHSSMSAFWRCSYAQFEDTRSKRTANRSAHLPDCRSENESNDIGYDETENHLKRHRFRLDIVSKHSHQLRFRRIRRRRQIRTILSHSHTSECFALTFVNGHYCQVWV